MAKQYTECCKPSDHSGWGGGVALTTVIGLAIAFVTGAWGLLGAVAIADLVVFLEWWLYRRLVCLDGEECAIGMLLTTEPPEKKSGFEALDTDFSINLVLPPHSIYTDRTTVENDGISGFLIAERAATRDIGLSFVGYTSKQFANRPDTPVLHGEFEGGGIYHLYQAAKAALVVATVAGVVCAIPLFGWIACVILAAVAAIILVVGLVVGLNDKGSPADVNAELSELHTNDPTGFGADILVIKGDWVYDSLHDGWNEIHPILQAQRIGRWSGSWSFDPKITRDHWCRALTDADSEDTRKDQLRAENQWEVHPVVDGCRPEQGPIG